MNDILNNALNEIDEHLIEEAAHADRAEHRGLKAARNIGFFLCGAAAAAAALTFGINHHLASLPEKVDLLPTESNVTSSDISEAIAENALRSIPVERVDIADVDRARLSGCYPYFIDAGNQWKTFDNDGNMLSDVNTIVIMDCGGYWVDYDITASDGVIYELLDVRAALGKAEEVLGASLLPGNEGVSMGEYKLSEYDCSYTVTASFDNGRCLNYRLICDTDHEQWTMTLLSDKADYMADKAHGANFFREERAGVYDSARFSDGYGAYICDNNGEIRVVKHTADGYFGYLPFGGKEYIYTLENTDTGRREKYCVKENGDAFVTSEDFLTTGGVEHQDDPRNITVPSWVNIINDMGSGQRNAVGASKVYNLTYAPDYNGLVLQFLEDKDGKLFLYDFTRLYPCTLTESDTDTLNAYCMRIEFFEGRDVPDDYITYIYEVIIYDDTIMLRNDCEFFIDEQGEVKQITLYKGTEFTEFSANGAGEEMPEDLCGEANRRIIPKVLAAQSENDGQTVYSHEEFICPVNDKYANITAYFGYDSWTAGCYYGICFGSENISGADIYAAQSGTVIISDFDEYYGNYVVIDHGNGYATLYAHCSDVAVNEGRTVSQGDVIGHVGATGFTAGDCLHFETRVNGVAVDPANYTDIHENRGSSDLADNETSPLPVRNKTFNTKYPEGYDGPELQFFTDNNGYLFLTDFTWTYPCKVEDLSHLQENFYEIYIDFWPEGRVFPDGVVTNSSTVALLSDETLTLDMDAAMHIVHNDIDMEIVIPKGTVFKAYDSAPAGLGLDELNERWAKLIASVPNPNFLCPVGGDYAIVEHMYGHTSESGYYGHSGIDIGAALGEPVLAAADGEVILAE